MKQKFKQVLSKTFKALLLIRLPYYKKHILLVRLDFVGDYILFRNGLTEIRNSKRFKGYKITLLGNIVFKDVAEIYDRGTIDHFIWIDPKILGGGFQKKFLLLLKLKLKAYEIIINPTLSVTLRTDLFIKYINAKITIGSNRNELNPLLSDKDRKFSESCYSELIDVPDNRHFEFFRNLKFIENLIQSTNRSIKLELPIAKKEKAIRGAPIKIVLVPGASMAYRRWSTAYFAAVAQELNDHYKGNCIFYITGSKNETILGKEICTNDSIKKGIQLQNLVGKTTVIETIDLINDCNLLISNETGTVHIAAAVKTPAVCISNGNDFGRFNPYPPSLASNIITLYPNDNFSNSKLFYLNVTKHVASDLDINDIKVHAVFNAAKTLLEKIN